MGIYRIACLSLLLLGSIGCQSVPRIETTTLAAYPADYPFGRHGSLDHPNGFDGRPGDADHPDGGRGGNGYAGGDGGRGGDAFGSGDAGDGGIGGHIDSDGVAGRGGDGGNAPRGHAGDGGDGGNAYPEGTGGNGGNGGHGRYAGDGGDGGNARIAGMPGQAGTDGTLLGMHDGEAGKPGKSRVNAAQAALDFLALQFNVEKTLRNNLAVAADIESSQSNDEADCLPVDIRFIGRGKSGVTFRGQSLPAFDHTTLVDVEYVLNPLFIIQNQRVTVEVESAEPGQRTVLALRWGTLNDPAVGFVTLKDAKSIDGQPGRYLLKLESQASVPNDPAEGLTHFVLRSTLKDATFDEIRIVPTTVDHADKDQVVILNSDK